MPSKYFRWALCIALALTLLPLTELPANAGDPGSAGMLWLRLGVGARSGGMGETGVAEASDATAMYWNPANMVHSEGTQVTVQHLEHFGLFRKESAAVTHNTPHGTVGLLFSGFYSETLDRTTLDRVGVPQGTFRPYDLMVGLGYGHAFRDISVGITAKFLYERIDAYDATGLAVDLGLNHRSKIEGLTLAAAIQNFGDKMTLKEEPFDLPVTLRLGASYTPHLEGDSFLEIFTGAPEIVAPNDGNGRFHAGLEARIHELFALRAGHRFNYDTYGVTAGAGFKRNNLSVDYAFMHNENDFEHNHRFSVSFAFLP
jgi:hypothetical protein